MKYSIRFITSLLVIVLYSINARAENDQTYYNNSDPDFSEFHSKRYTTSLTEKAQAVEKAYQECEGLKRQYVNSQSSQENFSGSSKGKANQAAFDKYRDCIKNASTKQYEGDTYLKDSETGESIRLIEEIPIKPQP